MASVLPCLRPQHVTISPRPSGPARAAGHDEERPAACRAPSPRPLSTSAMYTVHIWLKKKDGMSPEEFRDYWLEKHAPITRDGYEHLRSYKVHLVTGAPRGQDVLYDG